MTYKDSFDSKVLRWSGFALTAFLVAVFALGSAQAGSFDQRATYACDPSPANVALP